MTNETKIAAKIINNIETSLQGAYAPQIMKENILSEAQTLVNEEGYLWTVALTIAAKIYPITENAGRYIYSK